MHNKSLRGHTTALRTWVAAWGPVLVLMILIFVASAQPKVEIADKSSSIYFSHLMPVFPGGWEFAIKKSAHMLVYGTLALLSRRALILHGITPRQALWLALIVTIAYAVTDEFHQSFVTGRTATVRDLGFDLVGAAVCLLLVQRVTRRSPA